MGDALRLAFLGGFNVTRAEAPIQGFVSRKTEALLCYLAVTGRSQRRAALATLLWGDLPDERANLSLRQSLHNLRRLLPEYLHVTRDEVAFRRDGVYWLDVEVFASAFDGAALDSQRAPLRALAAAADLYRGPFLAGFAVRDAPDFTDWVVIEGERLHQIALSGQRALTSRYADRGDYTAALHHAGRLLALEPWQEEGHRLVMTVLARAGRRVDALRQYEVCRRALAEELGVAPSPETTALADQIRRGALTPVPASTAPPSGPRRAATLPAPLTPLIGREREVAAVRDLLQRPDVRLVTLRGPGGVGKTRLALAVARGLAAAFADGAAFVTLAAVRDPALVAPAIAAALDLTAGSDQPPVEKLRAFLRDREFLLVVDNLEHLLAAAPLLTELLGACPQLAVLATSRATLRLRGEHVYTVPPLACPHPATACSPDDLARYPAVALYAARASAAQPSFALDDANAGAVAEICVRLEGLPLAIELAAARTSLLPPQALLGRLGQRLAVLTGGARDLPDRQRTLRATIAWSHDLLTTEEQALFRRLAVFAGGATLEAAEAVCDPDSARDILGGLAALVDRSLLRQADTGGEPRVTMLETLHEYATERLEASGEAAALRRRHAAHYLALAETAAPELAGAAQATWLARLAAEHDNLRAALTWALAADPAVGLRLAASLWQFWWTHGHLAEGRGWLEQFLARGPVGGEEHAALAARAGALLGAGCLAMQQSDWDTARAHLEAGLALSRTLDDRRLTAWLLRELGFLLTYTSQYDAGRPLLEEALAMSRALADSQGLEDALLQRARLARQQGEYEYGGALLDEALAVAQARRSVRSLAAIRAVRGDLARCQGDLVGALAEYEAGLAAAREVGYPTYVAWTIAGLGQVALWRGETARAVALLEEGLALHRELGNPHSVSFVLHILGLAAWRAGDAARADGLLREALALRWQLRGRVGTADSLAGLAAVAMSQGQPGRAARLLAVAEAVYQARAAQPEAAERALTMAAAAAARLALGEPAFAAAWAAGAALPLEQAVAEALGAGP